jgi:DNA segregation ATPase FtsK/SpoIIIE-like protein
MEATTRQMLERLADRIEATLAGHKISVRITGGQISPRWIQFQALPALGTRITRLEAMVDVLAAAVDAETCHVTTQRGLVLIEIPHPDVPRDEQPSRPEREPANQQSAEPTPTSISPSEVPTPLPLSLPPIRARRRERIDL